MLFFRSEELVRAWCAANGHALRPLVTMEQLQGLAVAWYGTRLSPDARRPAQLLHFMSHTPFEPTFVVDVEPVWERKREAVMAYATQLESSGEGDAGQHFLYGSDIWERVETKARTFGERIRRRYGEPLLAREAVSFDDPIVRWLGRG